MPHMDKLHLRFPFYRARRLRDGRLDKHGLMVGRKHIRRLMIRMGIRAAYPGNKNTSKPIASIPID